MRPAPVLLLVLALPLAAQERVVLGDRGPGASGPLLEEVLARPHRLVGPDTGRFRLRRTEQLRGGLVVLGHTAVVEGTVSGDVVVVGGDLFVRPGGRIGGRAIAIGGGVYPSTLSVVEQGARSFRDNTYAIERDGAGYRLTYRSLVVRDDRPLLLPGVYGLRLPAYDRVNGLSLPFGPALSLMGGRAEIDALVTYRSDLGAMDPSVRVDARLTRRLRIDAAAGRGTWTNDAWIWSDFVNSFSVLTSGDDTRNYYRADRASVALHRLWEWTAARVEPFVGATFEDAWSVGPAQGERRGPWSVFGKADTLAMYRPNPPVLAGVVASGLAGAAWRRETDDLDVGVRTRVERSYRTPLTEQFTQVTTTFDAAFPTFGEQEYAMDVHWVTSAGALPPQRFAYLGGPGTLPFHETLELGGGEVLLVDQRYAIPVPSVRLGLLGEPTLIFRHRMGSAGLTALGDIEQLLGAGVLLTILRLEVQVDPVQGKARLTTGFSFSR